MFILSGIFFLVLICSSILALASIPISLYPKKKAIRNTHVKDYYSSLFDVYGDEA
ncbi:MULTISPECIES: hypothetical protein [Cytobacillus]|uniref:hypothetical protein n=1 Tax=Cytobacillus TaxID=2675230 RepID=UPI00203F6F49|nr:hypothetical protein [Cytobacillus firmus]MCM3708744.1 hypothetical protein [Cytobacillus firmus]